MKVSGCDKVISNYGNVYHDYGSTVLPLSNEGIPREMKKVMAGSQRDSYQIRGGQGRSIFIFAFGSWSYARDRIYNQRLVVERVNPAWTGFSYFENHNTYSLENGDERSAISV